MFSITDNKCYYCKLGLTTYHSYFECKLCQPFESVRFFNYDKNFIKGNLQYITFTTKLFDLIYCISREPLYGDYIDVGEVYIRDISCSDIIAKLPNDWVVDKTIQQIYDKLNNLKVFI